MYTIKLGVKTGKKITFQMNFLFRYDKNAMN